MHAFTKRKSTSAVSLAFVFLNSLGGSWSARRSTSRILRMYITVKHRESWKVSISFCMDLMFTLIWALPTTSTCTVWSRSRANTTILASFGSSSPLLVPTFFSILRLWSCSSSRASTKISYGRCKLVFRKQYSHWRSRCSVYFSYSS